ncbi:MAG: crossover junction endodeoxyribonuclease RuvC [Phycisphaerales bacterium]|nr:crossover junction endodeoxyribonuclease RuvC [Phycisphaerales bacterium]
MGRILCGVDPGLGVTGYAVVRAESGRLELIDAGALRTDESLELPDRLCQLDDDFASVLRDHRPEVVAVEDLYSHYKHPRTSILMGHARGVILCTAAKLHVKVTPYPATRVKKYLTGNGHASKDQIQRAVARTLGLAAPPEPPDVADALALALCCAGGE